VAFQPTAGGWVGVELLETGPEGDVWLAKGPTGVGLLKLARTPESRAGLSRELEVLRRLEHPRVAKLLEADPAGAWLVRSFVDGEDLRTWSRDRPVAEAVEICADLAETLSHLHERGVIHADLKPANVVMDARGNPHLIDLGCAFLEGEEVQSGAFRGTLGFSAPEQLQGRLPLPQTDYYSLACLLYKLLTGRAPFVSSDPAALAYLPLANLPSPPSTYRLEVEAHLDNALLDLLAREPTRRPADGHDIAALLRRSLYERGLPQLLGQPRSRQHLRQLVALASKGKPGAAVIYGPDGSGRRSLIQEAIQVARREGLEHLEMEEDALELPEEVRDGTFRLLVMPLAGRHTVEMAREVLQAGLCCLVLVWGRRPLMELGTLGARHISPEPLEVRHVARLLERHGQDPARAAVVHRRARGLPGRVQSQLMVPEIRSEPLTGPERQLVEATTGRPVPLPALAELLGLGHHALVDLAEPLVDRGLLQVTDGGRGLQSAKV